MWENSVINVPFDTLMIRGKEIFKLFGTNTKIWKKCAKKMSKKLSIFKSTFLSGIPVFYISFKLFMLERVLCLPWSLTPRAHRSFVSFFRRKNLQYLSIFSLPRFESRPVVSHGLGHISPPVQKKNPSRKSVPWKGRSNCLNYLLEWFLLNL